MEVYIDKWDKTFTNQYLPVLHETQSTLFYTGWLINSNVIHSCFLVSLTSSVWIA